MVPAFKNVKLEPKDPLAKSIMKYNGEGRTLTWQFTNVGKNFGMQVVAPIQAQYGKNGDLNKFLDSLDKAAKGYASM